MVIFKDLSVILEFLPEVPCIIWKPINFMTDDAWRKPFVLGMDFMEEKIKSMPHIGWINDTRLLKVVKPNDLLWLNENVNDRAYKFGAKKVAFVMPRSDFGKVAMKIYTSFTSRRTDNIFQIKAFETLDEAKYWITSYNKPHSL